MMSKGKGMMTKGSKGKGGMGKGGMGMSKGKGGMGKGRLLKAAKKVKGQCPEPKKKKRSLAETSETDASFIDEEELDEETRKYRLFYY
jgi:hypothetical protein